ncbi:hypothetical protein B7725_01775 [Streptococcus oralis subsp. tigurinus]|uniref:Uncharacterized protein n=1 Tax=Streptococcus oralis subsp. tigurinus TaxID=1077464 RepID=A0A1X1GT98_STROR|nr:hypothetical protein B7725_01775 [Streptococcus oralis subsp. tigurinus]
MLKEIRRRKYFFITEKGYKTDLKKRRELGAAVYYLTNIGFMVILVVISVLNSLNLVAFKGLIAIVAIGAMIIALAGIIIAAKNYLTGLYYYLIPLAMLLFTLDYVKSFSDIKSIVVYIILVFIAYSVFAILLPLHSLRKITNMTWLFGVLTTLLVPLLFEYFFQYYIINEINGQISNESITLETLMKLNLSTEVISFFKENPDAIELIKRFREMSISFEIHSLTSELSVIRFLLLTAYSLGTIIITSKIKLGKSKAKDLYNNIKSSPEVQYSELRDCIFYGGEEYENRIMDNEILRSKIISEEEKCDKNQYSKWWEIWSAKFIETCSLILKKMI